MTLVELLVVLALLGIIAAIAIPRYNTLTDRAHAAVMAEQAHTAQIGVVELEALPLDSLPPEGTYDADAVAADPVLRTRVNPASLRGPHGIRVLLRLARDPDASAAMSFSLEYRAEAGDPRQQGILRMLAAYTGDRYTDAGDGTARFDFYQRPMRRRDPPEQPEPTEGDSTAACPPAGTVPASQLPAHCRTP